MVIIFSINTIALADVGLDDNRVEYKRMTQEIIEEEDKIRGYNEKIEKCLMDIGVKEDKIGELSLEIKKKTEDIQKLEKEIENLQALINQRVRESYKESMYFNFTTYIITSDLTNLLDNIDFIVKILNNDRRTMVVIEKKKSEIKVAKDSLIESKSQEQELNDNMKKTKEELDKLLEEQLKLVEELKVKRTEFDEKYLSVSERELIKWHKEVIKDKKSTSAELYEVSQQLVYLRDNQIISPTVIEEINSLLTEYEDRLKEIGGDGSTGGAIVNYAYQFIGVPYVWGGTTPNGWDCSGFTSYIYRNVLGIEITRTTYTQRYQGISIGYNDLQLGDLVFTNGYEHVGIYVGGGNYIHAPQPGDTTRITPIYGFNEGRRIIY
jgi:peptidoglycan hydrolase CwlO-like protein